MSVIPSAAIKIQASEDRWSLSSRITAQALLWIPSSEKSCLFAIAQHCPHDGTNHPLPSHARSSLCLSGAVLGRGGVHWTSLNPDSFSKWECNAGFEGSKPQAPWEQSAGHEWGAPPPTPGGNPLEPQEAGASKTPGDLGEREARWEEVWGQVTLRYSSWVFPSLFTDKKTQSQELK